MMACLLMALFIGTSQATLSSTDPSSCDWDGTVELASHHLMVNLQNPLYADIEEEALLYVRGDAYTNCNENALEIAGELTFPKNSAVVGLFLWNGSQILKGKLKPIAEATNAYEAIVDRQTSPPPQPRDPALLTRVSQNNYKLSVYPASLNAYRKVRVRYLVPVNAVSGTYELRPVLSTGMADGQLDIEVKGMEGEVQIKREETSTPLSMPGQIQINWAGDFSLVPPNAKSNQRFALHSKVASPEWKGDYVLLDLPIPDSLLKKTGIRREVVVMWRWNFPEYYVDADGDLTDYGKQALDQGDKILAAMETSSQNDPNLWWGLAQQTMPGMRFIFPCGSWSSTNYKNMTTHLKNVRNNVRKLVPGWPAKPQVSNATEIRKIKENGRADFDSLMRTSVTLFSAADNVVKHIILVTSGPSFKVELPGYTDLQEYSLQNGISISGLMSSKDSVTYGDWPGVNVPKVAQAYLSPRTMNSWNGLPTPDMTSYYASLNWGGKNRMYQINSDQRLRLALHDTNAIGNVISWKSLDRTGKTIAEQKETLLFQGADNDSGLVKLFAATELAESSVLPSEMLGAVYGVVRRDYALVALEEDSIGTALSQLYSKEGLPYLSSGEIYMPTRIKDQNADAKNLRILLQGRLLQIYLDSDLGAKARVIEVLDMQGKVMARIDAGSVVGGAVRLGLEQWEAGIYCVRVQNKLGGYTHKTFVLR